MLTKRSACTDTDAYNTACPSPGIINVKDGPFSLKSVKNLEQPEANVSYSFTI